MEQEQLSETLQNIISFNNIKHVVPVISNSFRLEQIFRNEESITNITAKIPELMDDDLTINEQLTRLWAKEIHYPMTDDHKLWRVAQYYQVKRKGSDRAKEEYLRFLKKQLLDANETKEGKEELVNGFRKDARTMSFSDIAKGLGYFTDPERGPDPLFTLARLPFPVYVTTSHHDFLERAIEEVSRGTIKPRTQVIFWQPDVEYDEAIAEKHYPDPSFDPTPEKPAVYHLFGLQNYPGSLVLSEDDYMKFLVSIITSDRDTQKAIVPPRLRRALSTSHLLLMGYHLRDWEFRVLFRLILNYRQGDKEGIFIQLKPKKEDEELLDYLKQYFNMQKFEIEWKSSAKFIQELWDLWKADQA
jgi:hypothetical protein